MDYGVWGDEMPGRAIYSNNHRHGFNGKWKDDEWTAVSGATYDFGARMYDARLGRWQIVDAEAHKKPALSPYAYGMNNPYVLMDPDGNSETPSEYLQTKFDIKLEPFVAGFLDGALENISAYALVMFAKDLSDEQFRTEFFEAMKVAASDPVGFAKTIIESEIQNIKDVVEFNDKGQYKMGSVVGGKAAVIITGGGALLLLKYTKEFKEKLGLAKKLMKKLPCDCFVAETQVLTDSGYVDIEKLRQGDQVVALMDDGTLGHRTVTDIHMVQQPEMLYHLHAGNEVIKASGTHRFFVNEQWKELRYLARGDLLKTDEGQYVAIDSIKVQPGQFMTYNISVEGVHNYYVSDLNVLVHNCDVDVPSPELINKNGLRTKDGKYASAKGNNKASADVEKKVMDELDEKYTKKGWTVIKDQVQVKDATGQIRKYDGALKSPSGNVIGVEVKSGGSMKKNPNKKQKTFDQRLNSDKNNTAKGKDGMTVNRAITIYR